MKYLVAVVLLVAAGCAHIPVGRTGTALDRPEPSARAMAHYLAALVHERNGDFDQAMQEIQKASLLDPRARTLHVKLMAYYLRLQEFDEALAVAEKAIGLAPEDDTLRVWQGIILQQLGRYDEAAGALRKAIDLNPQNALGYEALIALQEKTNDWTGAIELYRELIQLVPDSPALYYQLGLSYVRVNDRDEAVPALEKAIQLNPRFAPVHFVLGLSHFEEGDLAAAEKAFRQYLALSPRDPRGYVHLAAVLARESRFDEALVLLNVVTAVSEAEPGYALQRMFLLLLAGKYDEIESAAPQSGAPVLGTLFRSLGRMLQGQPFEELTGGLDAIEGDLDAEIDEYLNEIVFLYGQDMAGGFLVRHLSEMRNRGVASQTLDLTLARVYLNLDRDAEAAPILSELIERGASGKWPHYYLATVYEAMNNIEGAEQQLRICLEIDPKDADVMNFLGYMYADVNMKLDEAEQLLTQALELDPDNGFYLDSMGWVYYRQGKADLAIKYIQKAILAMESDDAELRNHLGDAYLLKGDLGKAVKEWTRAHRLDPELEGVKEKLDQHAPRE